MLPKTSIVLSIGVPVNPTYVAFGKDSLRCFANPRFDYSF